MIRWILWACENTTGACSEQTHFTHNQETREREMGLHTSNNLMLDPTCEWFYCAPTATPKGQILQGHLKHIVTAGYNRHLQINSLNSELFLKSITHLVL